MENETTAEKLAEYDYIAYSRASRETALEALENTVITLNRIVDTIEDEETFNRVTEIINTTLTPL